MQLGLECQSSVLLIQNLVQALLKIMAVQECRLHISDSKQSFWHCTAGAAVCHHKHEASRQVSTFTPHLAHLHITG